MIAPRNCDLWPELGFLRGAPSATRTRDLLLRRTLPATPRPASVQVMQAIGTS